MSNILWFLSGCNLTVGIGNLIFYNSHDWLHITVGLFSLVIGTIV
jgi:hypothetical protein